MRFWTKTASATTEKAGRSFLVRLARDTRGNTLAMMAAAMIPMIGFAGSAIDMARLYVVKVRLQQACDAGVLAGRKVMTDTSLTTPLDDTAKNQAQTFFSNNFRSGWYRNTGAAFTPTKAANGVGATVANAVSGAATATVPMALMSFFGIQPVKLDVTCQAVFDLADTDVMFVLDTTGSMSCTPSDPVTCAGPIQPYTRSDGTTGYANQEKSDSKIGALRKAVELFDTTMRANADKTTNFRYGFVTYSSAVNVGGIIPTGYLQNGTWTYQSRHVQSDYNYGSSFQQSINVPQSSCPTGGTIRMPAGNAYVRSYTGLWTDEGYYQARVYSNISYANGVCSGTGQRVRPMWRYEPTSLDISRWSAGATVVNPSRLDGSTGKWRGCIEEVNTVTGSSFDVNKLPDDLNPDFKPSSSSNKWRPQWPDAEWTRDTYGASDVKDENINESDPNASYYNRNYGPGAFYDRNGSAACGMPAMTLTDMTAPANAQRVKNYVNSVDFKAYGGTYHDVGMIWGTRMISPDGVFAATTAAWPGRKAPSRNIVFMTDGAMAPNQASYGQYGIELWENRTGGQNNTTTDFNNHTARFRVVCEAAKRKGITIYVVALGTAITPDLTFCASPGQTFQASSTDALTAAFKAIAQRVAQLRITQ